MALRVFYFLKYFFTPSSRFLDFSISAYNRCFFSNSCIVIIVVFLVKHSCLLRFFVEAAVGIAFSLINPVNTFLLALLWRHLICLPCGVAAFVVRDTESVCVLLVDKFVPAVYSDCHDRLVRGVAAIYGSELGIVYLVDVLVELQELCNTEFAVRTVAEELVASVLYTLSAPTELHQLLAEDSPETYPLATDLNGIAHCWKINSKPIDERHYLCCRGRRLVAEDR